MIDELAADAARFGDDDEIRRILEEVAALTRMGFVAVARVTEARWIAYQVLDQIDFGMSPGDELRISTTICNDIRESGNAVVIDDVSAIRVGTAIRRPRSMASRAMCRCRSSFRTARFLERCARSIPIRASCAGGHGTDAQAIRGPRREHSVAAPCN
jgi:hypothetical protein